MEGNKYFTPEIKDIRVGYELESQISIWPNDMPYFENEQEYKEWFNNNFTRIIVGEDRKLDFIIKAIKDYPEFYRVPYLTKEQIEAEGWEFRGTVKNSDGGIIQYYYYDKRYEFSGGGKSGCIFNSINFEKGDVSTIFRGQCKDINTFRYISKLLGI